MAFDSLMPQPPMSMPAANAYAAECLARSRAVANCSRSVLDVPYGQHVQQRLDIYLPDEASFGGGGPRLPVFAFLHGGSWTHGYKEWMGFMAPPITAHPAIFVSVGYRLAPEHKFPAQRDDVLSALAWLARNIARHGGDGRHLFIGGHSAGGHLAALAALEPQAPVRGCMPVSATFDLRVAGADAKGDIANIHRDLLLRPEDAVAASPICHLAERDTPFYLSWGERDFERVIATSKAMSAALGREGRLVAQDVFKGCDHFEMSLMLGDAACPWVTRVREMLGHTD